MDSVIIETLKDENLDIIKVTDERNEAVIIYLGRFVKLVCDGQCCKAWGINSRQLIQLSDDKNDFVYLADHELGIAPRESCTPDGKFIKPFSSDEFPNKWCFNECERCRVSEPGKYNEPLELRDWNKRVYNFSSWR